MKRTSTADAAAPKDEFRLEEFLPYQLSLAATRVSRLFARHFSEAFGLTIPEWRVIAVVGRFEAISPSRVSDWTGMDKVKVSRAAATLVARGLLRQTQDPGDGRARVLRMTKKGEKVFAGVVPLARKVEADVTTALNRAEAAALRRALAKLKAYVDEVGGPDLPAEID